MEAIQNNCWHQTRRTKPIYFWMHMLDWQPDNTVRAQHHLFAVVQPHNPYATPIKCDFSLKKVYFHSHFVLKLGMKTANTFSRSPWELQTQPFCSNSPLTVIPGVKLDRSVVMCSFWTVGTFWIFFSRRGSTNQKQGYSILEDSRRFVSISSSK